MSCKHKPYHDDKSCTGQPSANHITISPAVEPIQADWNRPPSDNTEAAYPYAMIESPPVRFLAPPPFKTGKW
ncbi:hypothetical protein IAQ61_004804 [Plenodomus lingam]|uniref:uncharacterized protein n=1 Tax=Leptosphaeria maculans TaxID=5022 RepID=UPI00331F9A71|nr:hypothetical protein IAQ61_004804 [Plenodomus lingam]